MNLRIRMPALFALIAVLIAAVPALGAVVAKGEGVVVTSEDVAAMLESTSPDFTPTKDALVKATIKTVLFAKEAVDEEFPCEEVYGKEGFKKILTLSQCYIRGVLALKGLMPGSVESYYRAHPEFFKGKGGKLIPLDDDMKKKIELGILKTKAPIFARNEFQRLFQKYKVRICDSDGCK